MEIFSQLSLIILLIIINSFFVASEYSLVTLRKSRIEEMARKGNIAAKLVLNALQNLDKYISVTQLGVTMTSLVLGWLGEPVLANQLIKLLSFLPRGISAFSANMVAIIIAFSLITLMDVVLGELVPKAIALERTEGVALITITPLTFFATVFQPIVKILHEIANKILRILNFNGPYEKQLIQTAEDIDAILDQSGKSGVLPMEEVEMLQNVLKLGDIPIKQFIIPKTDIVAFNTTIKLSDLEKKIEHFTHSRFPVYEDTIENIVGFIHIKDVYKILLNTDTSVRLSESGLIRKTIDIPEMKKANDVLLDMRKNHVHLSVVRDEFGQTLGIVTLEDIIESLVGEIQDEFDRPIKDIKRRIDGSYIIEGQAPLVRIQKRFNFPEKYLNYATVGGMVFGLLGREPKVGDKIRIANYLIEVESLDKKRIKKVILTKETNNKFKK